MSKSKVTGAQVWKAIKIVESATPRLCESLIRKYGTSRRAADSIGVSAAHFCDMINGFSQASLKTLAVMCVEVDE